MDQPIALLLRDQGQALNRLFGEIDESLPELAEAGAALSATRAALNEGLEAARKAVAGVAPVAGAVVVAEAVVAAAARRMRQATTLHRPVR